MTGDLLPHALEWLAAGYAPLPIGMTEKHPCVSGYHGITAKPAGEAEVRAWFGNGSGYGLGAATGCGGLEMLEAEGGAVAEGKLAEFVEELAARGLAPLWERIVAGYAERSPSGGYHVCYRVTGGEARRSTRLAQRPENAAELDAREMTPVEEKKGVKKPNPVVQIETRGTGGFTVLAPTAKDDGRAWQLLCGGPRVLAEVTPAERDALFDAARACDTYQAWRAAWKAARQARIKLDNIQNDPAGQAEVPSAALAYAPWPDIMEPAGWAYVADDDQGHQQWRRPGKDTGISATTSEGGGLYVFSTSTDFDTDVPYSKAAAVAVLHEWMDADEALERYGTAAESRQAAQDWVLPTSGRPASEVAAERIAEAAAAGGFPPGAESAGALNLPEEFWSALPVLGRIRQAAWSRTRSADAVLGTLMARVAAMWPPALRLDTGVASAASANFYVVPAGPPGTGKSTSVPVARDLLPELPWYPGLAILPGNPHPKFADGLPLGSGEGLAEMYMGTVERTDAKGKPKFVKEKTRDHAYVFTDEGASLAAMLQRSGATIGAALRSAWMGETIGQANASADTTRIVPQGSYSLGLVIGFQPATAGLLLADGAAGTPQRFTYVHATDPLIPAEPSAWPGPLTITWPGCEPGRGWGGTMPPVPFAGAVRREIRARSLARSRGEETAAPGAEHEVLTRCKTGAILAVLDGRGSVDEEVWALTAVMWKTSCAVRDWLGAWGAQQSAQAEQWARNIGAGRKVAEAEALGERVMFRAARSAGRHVHKKECDGGCRRRCITLSMSGEARKAVTVDEVITRLLETRVIKAEGQGFKPGPVSPG